MRVTVIFDNFGPYHRARLRAAARGCDLTAIEVAAGSAEYAWEREPGNGDPQVRHLAPTLDLNPAPSSQPSPPVGEKMSAGRLRGSRERQAGNGERNTGDPQARHMNPTLDLNPAPSSQPSPPVGEKVSAGRLRGSRERQADDGGKAGGEVGIADFKHVTLLERGTSREVSGGELVRRLATALAAAQPDVVFIPGWSGRAAFAALDWCARHKVPAVAMSESTAWDEPRRAWKEFVKRRLVGLCASAFAGGSPHRDYLVQLGMPAERIFLGYDAVDNCYFEQKAAEVRRQRSEVRGQKSESGERGESSPNPDSRLEPLNQTERGCPQPQQRGLPTAGSDYPAADPLRPPAAAGDSRAPVHGEEASGSPTQLPSPQPSPRLGGVRESGTVPGGTLGEPIAGYFLASARFIAKKNLPCLIEAYARYRQLVEELETGNRQSGDTSPRPSPRSGEGAAETLESEKLKSAAGNPATRNPQPATLPWPLVLLGDGALRETLSAKLSTLNLHAHVRLPGFIQYPELPHYYARAGAFIHASTTEPWGLVVNEAMASGLPVLVSHRCGCARDLVQEGVNGFTFDPDDAGQLAQLMLKLSTLPDAQPSTPNSQLSTLNPQLSAMGAASQRIIADWGPDRFAEGLQQAAECARRAGPVPPTLIQTLVLKALALK